MKKVIVQVLLLALPTAVLMFYLLWRLNQFYAILENHWIKQGAYFLIGTVAAIIFYAYRFRFITTALVLFVVNLVVYRILGSINASEFDAFYFSIQFMAFSVLFCTGWLVGFGFSRSRYFTVFWSVLLLVIHIVVVSKTSDITASALINAFVPVVAYSFYIIYTAELIRNMNEDEVSFGRFIFKRLAGFSLVLLVLFLVLLTLFKSSFKTIEKEWGGSRGQQQQQGKDGKGGESMTQKDKNGGVQNKDQSKLAGALNKSKELVFVAHLESFFDDGITPNPLYFTSNYYTKFDTATQTFEIDPQMPYNDLFSPDPSKIALYFKKTDPQIVKNSLGLLNRKSISTEVYNVNLSQHEFLAPSTAYFCQPVSVPKEFKQQYRSAYLAKMWVSDLNSAYFIYNPAGNKELEKFQEQRFELLRTVKEIKGPDVRFMNYYTYMPKDAEYNKIGELSKKITQHAEAPIDKIIAIRDYFLSKDEFSQPLFKYSDNPGIPGLPSANKLTYFLLENRKGYCAYFAGATLFMLRSLGIPSRVAIGYLAADRSSKNPGWYWFYQDQAHAWVQVYFNDYGWIDFDTTVPDVNTQQAPQPDGTPPTNTPQTFLVADGEVKTIDLRTKRLVMRVNKLLFHDTDYTFAGSRELLADVSLATVMSDTGATSLSALVKGMHITAISHAEALKNIHAKNNDSLAGIIKKLPAPVPVDELKIVIKDNPKKQKEKADAKKTGPPDWTNILWCILAGLVMLALLAWLLPVFIWQYLHAKASTGGAYHRYRAALYYLNQLGAGVGSDSPEDYAARIDKRFGTGFSVFSSLYQKIKYSATPLSNSEQQAIDNFYIPFIKSVRRQVPLKTRFSKFLNLNYTIHYFSKPK